MAPSTSAVGLPAAPVSPSSAAVPRIKPIIPLGFSRPSKSSSKNSATSPATPPSATDAATPLPDANQPLLEPPLTPDSAPSNPNSNVGIVTPADSLSDPLPVDQSSKTETVKTADAAIASPLSPTGRNTSPSEGLDPRAHFVPQNYNNYYVEPNAEPLDYNLPVEHMEYPVSMMPMYPDHNMYNFVPYGPVAYPNDEHNDLARSGSTVSASREGQRPPSTGVTSNFSQEADAFDVGRFLSSKFTSAEFADFMISITCQDPNLAIPAAPAHGLILSRSPTLSSLMFSIQREHAQTVNGLPLLRLHIEDPRLNPHNLLQGLSHLYGFPLPNFQAMFHPQASQEIFSAALSFAAAGRFLQVPYMMAHGTKTVMKYLAWVNVEQAIAFINDGARLYSAYPFNFQETEMAISSLENELLRHVIQFLAYFFPKDFIIHNTASELAEAPRLPAIIESRPSISHTRFSSIQFGEVSAEDSAKLDESKLLSSILLSAPTKVLQMLFDSHLLGGKLGWPKVRQVLQDTIAERERRRIKVHKTPAKRVVRGSSPQQWEAVHWEERLETVENNGLNLTIVRTRVEDAPQ